MNNYQQGGWYDNPQTGKNQQYWNGQWYDTPQQGGSSSSDPLSSYNAMLDQLNNQTNQYYNQQLGFGQTDYNNKTNLYNNENTQALGTQDQNAQQAFLSSILNPLQQSQGALEYGYNLGQDNENAMYGLNSTANQQNRDLALAKLANDENYNLQGLGIQQGNQNAQTIDSLNQRGLLYGQTPTGAYSPTSMGGMHGLAAGQASPVNQNFDIQRNQMTSDYTNSVLGQNQNYTQQQNQLNQQHQYNTSENAFNAANGVQNQNNQYSFNTAQASNQLAQYQAQLKQQQYESQQQNKQSAYGITGSPYNAG